MLAEKLQTDPSDITDEDNLVGLGIDSVTAMSLVGTWRLAGLSITYNDLAERPTLAGWWELLSEPDTAVLDQQEPAFQTVDRSSATDPGQPFELTPVQHAYWIGRTEGQVLGGVGCHAYFEFDGPGADPVRLERAVHDLIARHDMLRLTVHGDGRQQIQDSSPWPGLTCYDVRDLDHATIEERLDEIRTELSHRLLDVTHGEVFDIRLSLLPGGETRLHLNVDLLVADVMSIQILMADLAALYAEEELPPLRLSFPEYLAEVSRSRGAEREQARRYWQQRDENLRTGGPKLPLAKDPAQVERPHFRRRSHLISSEQFERLKDRARRHHVTPAMVLATAFAEVLGRWSSEQRFLLNLPLFDRLPGHPDVERLVADFTNLVLLEVDTGEDRVFSERVRAIQERFQQDASHSAYSAVEVLRDLNRSRPEEPVTAPIVFASNLGGEFVDPDFRKAFGEMNWMVSQTPQVWLDHQLYETTEGLLLTWDTVDELFPAGVIDAMFGAYGELVEQLAAPDSDWERGVLMSLPVEQRGRREETNATQAPVPDGLLHHGVVDQARRTPDRTALVDGNGTLTYGELLGRASTVANRLRTGGCAPGDIVAVAMPKECDQIVAVLGTLLTGAIYLPLDTNQPPARRNGILHDAHVRHVLVDSSQPDPGPWPDGITHVAVNELSASEDTPPDAGPCPEDLAYVIYTSGSTGTPKGVMISHRSALNTVVDINTRFDVGANDRVLGLANLGFDLSVFDIFGPLTRGGALVLPDPAHRGDPSHWADMISDHQVSLWNSVPAQLQMLDDYLDTGERTTELSSLRLALLSGDWLPVSLPDSIRAKLTRLRVVSLGGATEAAIWSIHHPVGTVCPEWSSIPYGKPLTNQCFHILDARLRDCPDWVRGELYIAGTGLARGYLGDPDRTAERFIEHPSTGERLYRTGDLGRYLPDGNIEFLGRADSQVKIRGHRVELGEIELALQRHPAVGSACVLAAGERTDRRLVAFVSGRHCPAEEGDATGLATAADTGGQQAAAAVLPQRLRAFAAALDEAVLLSIAHALRRMEVFDTPAREHTTDDVLRLTCTVPRHRWIVRRWLDSLRESGMLRYDVNLDTYSGLRAVSDAEVRTAWQRVRQVHAEGHDQWSVEAVELFQRSAGLLPELLRGEQDEVHLLFPEGNADTAVALFSDSLIAQYANHATVAALRELARRHDGPGPLRILEIGAGVGATSAEALEALADEDVEYLFTDVSSFFLNRAQERFGDVPFVNYGLFDMNEDFRSQGLEPNSFDVIVAANVLHNAHDADAMLARLRQLLTPGGWLVCTEPTRETLELMIFMAFLMAAGEGGVDFVDARRGQDRMLFGRDEWWRLLHDAGGSDIWELPAGQDAWMPSLGQRVFAARFKANQERVAPEDLLVELSDQLPEHMLPSQVQIVDAMPLTSNGKLDFVTLRSWQESTARSTLPEGVIWPRDPLEERIAGTWADVLGTDHVGVNQNFFDLGGDSLLITQLITTLREAVPETATHEFSTLLRAMLEQPTVAALAALVREEGER